DVLIRLDETEVAVAVAHFVEEPEQHFEPGGIDHFQVLKLQHEVPRAGGESVGERAAERVGLVRREVARDGHHADVAVFCVAHLHAASPGDVLLRCSCATWSLTSRSYSLKSSARKAGTRSGSNCVPALRRISSSTVERDIALRYVRLELMAS